MVSGILGRCCWLCLAMGLTLRAQGQAPARAALLAEMLEDPKLQAEVIQNLRLEPDGGKATVLGWIAKPPAGQATIPFEWGLVVAVGELGIREGIPYLLDHLAMHRMGDMLSDDFRRTDATRFPAVYALLKFGRPGFEALLKRREAPMTEQERLVVIHAIGLFRQPESEMILRTYLYYAVQQKAVAQNGLAGLQMAVGK